MGLAGILNVVSEQGGGHINKSFQPLLDSETEAAAGTSEVPIKKVSRKKKSAASEAGTGATTDVADVEEKEVSSEGTMGITQESGAIVGKGTIKPKPKRLKKKSVISPNVGDNLKKVEEEEDDEQETLLVRGRSKEERSKKTCQKQQARTGPSKRSRKAESSALDVLPSASEDVGEDEEREKVRFLIGKSSPTIEDLDKEIDEILVQAFKLPFISESLITLDDLVQEQQEEKPSDQAGGSDVDDRMGSEKDTKEVKDDERESEEDIGQREGKGVEEDNIEAEEDEKEDDEEDEEEGEDEANSDAPGMRPLLRKLHLGVLSKRRLRRPRLKMEGDMQMFYWGPLVME
ncbi:hypothetical protein Dimus_030698 [Dionaea muscipula]